MEKLEQIVQNLGFESLFEFTKTQIKAFFAEKKAIPTPIVWQNYGFENEQDFVRKQLKLFLEQQIGLCQAEIRFFEEKYAQNLPQMKEKYVQITDFDIVEKEMDEMEWEGEVRFLEGFQTLLKDLEDGEF